MLPGETRYNNDLSTERRKMTYTSIRLDFDSVTSLFASVIGEFYGGKWAGNRVTEIEPEALGIYLFEWLFLVWHSYI